MSAQANLAGLFPPTDEERWSDDIHWQPIPVHTVPWRLDHVLSSGRPNLRYEAAREKYLKEAPEIQQILTEHADIFKHLTEKCGEDIETIADVFFLHNTLTFQKSRDLPQVFFFVFKICSWIFKCTIFTIEGYRNGQKR